MAKKNVEHVTIRNQQLFCLNCGNEFKLVFPIGISEMNHKIKAFNDLHADCKKTWKEPTMSINEDIKKRMMFWLLKGERGLSSEVMFETITGEIIKGGKHHPVDPADFGRCYKLLELIPEFKQELRKLKKVSPQWEKLVNEWNKLTVYYEDMLVNKKDNGMYDFMKRLGC